MNEYWMRRFCIGVLYITFIWITSLTVCQHIVFSFLYGPSIQTVRLAIETAYNISQFSKTGIQTCSSRLVESCDIKVNIFSQLSYNESVTLIIENDQTLRNMLEAIQSQKNQTKIESDAIASVFSSSSSSQPPPCVSDLGLSNPISPALLQLQAAHYAYNVRVFSDFNAFVETLAARIQYDLEYTYNKTVRKVTLYLESLLPDFESTFAYMNVALSELAYLESILDMFSSVTMPAFITNAMDMIQRMMY